MSQQLFHPTLWRPIIRSIIPAGACLLLAAGCGGTEGPDPNRMPLSGVVTLNGEPLVGAEINFINENDEVGMRTGEGGVYGIPIGALPGKYKVTISKLKGLDKVPEGIAIAASPKENPETLPPQFSSPSQTSLEFTQPEGGTDKANFDLRTK